MSGASVASFISVYVERKHYKNRLKGIWGRSMCASCMKKLNAFELVPIFSYLFLRGKCSNCKQKIPSKLFFGEILLGTWFLSSFFYFLGQTGGKISFALCCLFGSLLYLLTLEDLESMEIEAKPMYLLVTVGIVEPIVRIYFANFNFSILKEIVLPLVVISPIIIIYLFNKNWMGEADPYIFSAIALFFGLQFTISSLIYSIWFGAFYGICYLAIVHKKYVRGIAIPLLPSIFFSTLFILLTNFHIIQISYILAINEIFFK
jgi:leader peptidase (prepilin peptidase)/N-methyltransferase